MCEHQRVGWAHVGDILEEAHRDGGGVVPGADDRVVVGNVVAIGRKVGHEPWCAVVANRAPDVDSSVVSGQRIVAGDGGEVPVTGENCGVGEYVEV